MYASHVNKNLAIYLYPVVLKHPIKIRATKALRQSCDSYVHLYSVWANGTIIPFVMASPISSLYDSYSRLDFANSYMNVCV